MSKGNQSKNSVITNNSIQYPFNVFISYKINECGDAVDNITQKLMLGHEDKLHIFASTSLKAGSPWRDEIHDELGKADLLILIYLDASEQYDWCFYETGFMCGGVYSGKKHGKIMVVTGEEIDIPDPVEGWQGVKLNSDGVGKLLKAIYYDPQKPIFALTSDQKTNKFLSEEFKKLTIYILKQLGPVRKKTLNPRLWITINDDQFKLMEKGELPHTIKINGESEAFKALGLDCNDEITLGEFIKVPDYNKPMTYFLPHLRNSLLKLKSNISGSSSLPPIRLLGSNARTLVPTVMTKKENYLSNNSYEYKFEYVVYEPVANFDRENSTLFTRMFNLFSITQHFRWRVIEKWLAQFENLFHSGSPPEEFDVLAAYKNFNLDYTQLLLDSHNRNFHFSKEIEKLFIDQNDVDKINELIGKNGVWFALNDRLQKSISKKNGEDTIQSLKEMKDINNQFLKLCLERLTDIVDEKSK